MSFVERLRLLREALGYDPETTAIEASLSAEDYSQIEAGSLEPDQAAVVALADALDFELTYLLRTDPVVGLGTLSGQTSGVDDEDYAMLMAQGRIGLERYRTIQNLLTADDPRAFAMPPGFPFDSGNDPTALMNAALSLRESWMLGTGPVGQLVDYLDFVGLPVIPVSGVSDFDAAACFTQDAGSAPLLLLSIDISGDVQRFGLAREMAHLLAPDVSVQGAGLFARTFLAHPVLLRADLGKARSDLDALELYTLKHRYGLSVANLLAHAQQLGIISAETYEDWNREMGENDWVFGEPGFDVPTEIPAVMLRRVRRLLVEGIIDEEQALELSVLPWLDMDLLTGYPFELIPEEEAE